MGLEFASDSTHRSSGKFLNCIFHGTAGGSSVWDAQNSERNGNILYNVGGYGPRTWT